MHLFDSPDGEDGPPCDLDILTAVQVLRHSKVCHLDSVVATDQTVPRGEVPVDVVPV